MLRALARSMRRMRMTVHKPFGRGLAADLLRVSLCDRNPDVARALAVAFRDVGGVEVLEGDLLALDCDALVSPANSFGYMDGGVEKQIDAFYRGDAQPAVLARIANHHYGELPVGSAAILEMATRRFPFLVVAPTMRVPGRVDGTINAYLAMRAAFAAVLDHNRSGARRIGSVAVPGLGTGIGGMAADESAVQLRAAHDMILGGGWMSVLHPAQAPFVMSGGKGSS
ncbi:macro domain-containing protein [Tundrisphaera sp. TA3]|uniref:macro domain-containing protein n=1 Tax=Tundrisphaera sp. TA3 TaxID=3435775 RepID=UPI003EBBBFBB